MGNLTSPAQLIPLGQIFNMSSVISLSLTGLKYNFFLHRAIRYQITELAGRSLPILVLKNKHLIRKGYIPWSIFLHTEHEQKWVHQAIHNLTCPTVLRQNQVLTAPEIILL